ncbi:hypothetical protein [Thermococcus barophilus]|uniref:Uncharacterized protein n=1 Tax=Thermococcus barophilus TaxID=55802 RepID=A0A0S1XDQ2_THEBA|nr:hypothetical protein [Thermococcus barophilus]ALM75824.1 hypothetical protein TBCH5v1_1919 [Thermococcus barophilus]
MISVRKFEYYEMELDVLEEQMVLFSTEEQPSEYKPRKETYHVIFKNDYVEINGHGINVRIRLTKNNVATLYFLLVKMAEKVMEAEDYKKLAEELKAYSAL